ncbi:MULTISPECIES: GUN4 domain-containing protein [unclassified Leptolyngbya]|uniref:GUN4 domain-containing protein n=1 Tax=unclassified Leptolyngbya TaxID=2650499 RepID=UPI0016843560|nr:GUN4 N-terminal ARM-like repeat domain-containing protein [Leptolyngbya sp. FACHB-8]MBD2157848.1 GUN4 N-terminal ARM-like repeat domain-containing protein [Leptolyngbya sp. FACHB-16]
MNEFLTRLRSESEKNQLRLVQDLADKGEAGLDALMEWCLERQGMPAAPTDGKVHQLLVAAKTPKTEAFVGKHLVEGVVELRSQASVDYRPIAQLLAQRDFEEADRTTLAKLCELAGDTAVKRGWLYFTEVEQFPSEDLQTLDRLWRVYSEGKFGFSVQRELWLGTGKNWDKLWPMIGWKSGNTWTRYPKEFIWDLSAPRGHLPLSNQLRGVRVMASLLTHPAWS